MTLRDVISDLRKFDSDHTIYVSRNLPQAEAIVAYEAEDGEVPDVAKGMRYFLEVSLARDVIRVWSEWRGGREPALDDKVGATIYYAENDAYMPVS